MRKKAGPPSTKPVRTVGVWINLRHEHFRRMLVGVSAACLARRWELRLLEGMDTPGLDAQMGPVEGVIAAITSPEHAAYFQSRRLPVVNVSNARPPADLDLVASDDEEVGRVAARHLIAKRYRRMAFFQIMDHAYTSARYRGMCEALAAHQIPPPDRHHHGTLAGFRHWLRAERTPAGIVAENDIAARQAAGHLLRMGFAVPARVAVVGVDDDPLESGLAPVPLSSVRIQSERIGALAVACLGKRFDHPLAARRHIRVPPAGVVTRRSSEDAAVESVVCRKALELLSTDYLRACTVPDLARKLGLPLRSLQHHFRKHLGSTVREEIAANRHARACTLLRTTDRSLGEIAEQVGLADSHSLCVAFRAREGLTPMQYRAQAEEG
jgi:LacI family transcriptional regulator